MVVTVLAIVALLSGQFLDFLLLLYPFGRVLACCLELLLLTWSTRPWRAFDSDVAGDVCACESNPRLSRRACRAALVIQRRADPRDARPLSAVQVVSSAEMLVLPRNSGLLNSLAVRSVAKLHATMIALFYFTLSFVIGTVCMLPISFTVLLFMTWSFYQLVELIADTIARRASFADLGWYALRRHAAARLMEPLHIGATAFTLDACVVGLGRAQVPDLHRLPCVAHRAGLLPARGQDQPEARLPRLAAALLRADLQHEHVASLVHLQPRERTRHRRGRRCRG
jgi:hypothetical protein